MCSQPLFLASVSSNLHTYQQRVVFTNFAANCWIGNVEGEFQPTDVKFSEYVCLETFGDVLETLLKKLKIGVMFQQSVLFDLSDSCTWRLYHEGLQKGHKLPTFNC